MKKFLVAVDIEGVALGICTFEGTIETTQNVAMAKLQATREAAAAVSALYDSGADEVVVWDNHSRGSNLDYDLLDERCKIAMGGSVNMRFPCLDESYSGIVLIGYHAMGSHPNAVAAHTYSASSFQHVKINGVEYGEAGIDAAIAGLKGVPVIFLSGDDMVIEETTKIMPWLETVETKKSLSYTRIISKHPKAVVKEIYEGVKKAYTRLGEMKPYVVKTPCELEVRYRRVENAEYSHLFDKDGKFFERVDGFTRRGIVNSPEDLMLKW